MHPSYRVRVKSGCMRRPALFIVTILTALTITVNLAYSKDTPITETKTKLSALERKIKNLQSKIDQSKNKQDVLSQELANTDKKIGEGVISLRLIQKNLQEKRQSIDFLQNDVDKLTSKLLRQQELLAKHLKARYQMGQYQPLKWLLNQESPDAVSRLLTFYHYVIRSYKERITAVKSTRETLNSRKEHLKAELLNQQQLEKELNLRQTRLSEEKAYQARLIQELNQDLQAKKQTLGSYQINKANLQQLLQSLSQQNKAASLVPFARMKYKLPKPVQTSQSGWKNLNQGIMFFAQEGLPVQAVYPGKVVFSDWLRGYGLLLIIDHGRGFMTLYAHNQALFKQKGETVEQGESIASVGHSGGISQNGLYFEIRLRGKAISPLDWLS